MYPPYVTIGGKEVFPAGGTASAVYADPSDRFAAPSVPPKPKLLSQDRACEAGSGGHRWLLGSLAVLAVLAVLVALGILLARLRRMS